MVIQRVSTSSLHATTIADTLKLQSKMANIQNQISSGYKSDTFQGLTGKVEAFVQFEAKMNKNQTLIDNNTLINSRLQTTDTALNELITVADQFQDLLVQRQNPVSGTSMSFSVNAKATLEAIAQLLNTEQEGRFLFGGTKTDIPPVKTPVPANFLSGVPDAAYYQGSDADVYARVQENQLMQYNVKANDPAFQKLIAAVNLSLQADSVNDMASMEEATQLATQAIDEIIGLRATVQQNQVTIQDINSRLSMLNLYWKGMAESIIKTDTVAASSELAVAQTVLQASFQSFVTLNSLRLVDYI